MKELSRMNNKLILNKDEVEAIKERALGGGFYRTCSFKKMCYLISKNVRFYCFKDAEKEDRVTYAFETNYYLRDCLRDFEEIRDERINYTTEEFDAIQDLLRESKRVWLDLKGEF